MLATVGLGLGVGACGRAPASRAGASSTRRVVSQTVLSDEVLWELGPAARAQVVAVSTLADDPRYSSVVDRWDRAVLRAPLTSEALLAAAPDLVILADFTSAPTRRLVQDAGVTTLELAGFDGFDDYRRHVREIATAVESSDEGDALVQRFDARLLQVRRATPRQRPGAISWIEGNVAGRGTTFDDIATAAGFDNLAARHGHVGHQQVSLEQLVAWDPAVLVVPCPPDGCDAAAAEVAARPGLSATRAARTGAIVAVPSVELYAVGAAMLDAVARLGAAHPEARRGP
jgi:iron complex transport system substrate-binding protein